MASFIVDIAIRSVLIALVVSVVLRVLRIKIPIAGMAMPGSGLKPRLRQILDGAPTAKISRARVTGTFALCAISSAVFAVGTLAPQTSKTSAASFDVVSIKPCGEERTSAGVAPPPRAGGRGSVAAGWTAQTTPGHVYWDCVTLASLVDLAYADREHPLLNMTGSAEPPHARGNVTPQRVRGGPSWTAADKFTIEAVGPADLTTSALAGSPGRNLGVLSIEMAVALRTVLEDRFQLKVRRVTEQQDMYALVVSEAGLNKANVTVPVAGDCVTKDRYFEIMASSSAPRSRADAPKICGTTSSMLVGSEFVEIYSSATFAQLANTLSGWQGIDRYVVDQTGIDTKFNFPFKQGTEDSAAARILSGLAPLGLKLKPVKAPAEYLQIDRAEQPRPNDPSAGVPIR